MPSSKNCNWGGLINISSIVSFRPPRHFFLHFFFWHFFVIIVIVWQINKYKYKYKINMSLDRVLHVKLWIVTHRQEFCLYFSSSNCLLNCCMLFWKMLAINIWSLWQAADWPTTNFPVVWLASFVLCVAPVKVLVAL